MLTKIEQVYSSALTAVGAGLISVVIWLVRVILTNQKKLELLEQDIAHRDALRREDSKRIEELHKDVREIREELRR